MGVEGRQDVGSGKQNLLQTGLAECPARRLIRKVAILPRRESGMNEQTGDMRALIEQIAKALVDEPDQVSVTQIDAAQDTVLELKVAPNDLGKVIGKQGRTARAMRNLLGATGMKFHKRFTLEILE